MGDLEPADVVAAGGGVLRATVAPRVARRLLEAMLLMALVGLAGLAVGARGPVAVAVEVYAPRGIEATAVPSGEWLALEVRAAGFRPNSVVLLDVGGAEQGTVMADAAGVVEARVPLPDRLGVRVRGVALDGGGLDLDQEVRLVRGGSPDGAPLVAVGLLLVLVGWIGRGWWAGRPSTTVVESPDPDPAPGR